MRTASIVSDARPSDLAANSPPKPEPTMTTRWRAALVGVMEFSLCSEVGATIQHATGPTARAAARSRKCRHSCGRQGADHDGPNALGGYGLPPAVDGSASPYRWVGWHEHFRDRDHRPLLSVP